MRGEAEARKQLAWALGMLRRHHHPYDAGYADALAWALGEAAPSKGPEASEAGAADPAAAGEVRAEVLVAAPPARALRAFLDPADLRAWWGASEALVEPMEGGAWAVAWPAGAAGERVLAAGRLREAGPRAVVVVGLVAAFPGLPLQGPMALHVEARAEGPGARVRVRQAGYGEDEAGSRLRKDAEAAWPQALDALRRHLGGAGERAA